MIGVIFEVEPAEEQEGVYLDTAADLRPLLDGIEGFVSVERFKSLTNPGKISRSPSSRANRLSPAGQAPPRIGAPKRSDATAFSQTIGCALLM